MTFNSRDGEPNAASGSTAKAPGLAGWPEVALTTGIADSLVAAAPGGNTGLIIAEIGATAPGEEAETDGLLEQPATMANAPATAAKQLKFINSPAQNPTAPEGSAEKGRQMNLV